MHAQPHCSTRRRRWPTPPPRTRPHKRPRSLGAASQRELVVLSLLLRPDAAADAPA
jgi:hypothetical protein